MKVLHTISRLQKNSGGLCSCTVELVRALNEIGITANMLTLAEKNSAIRSEFQQKFIHQVPDDAFCYDISRNFHRELWKNHHLYDLCHVHGLWRFTNYDTMRFCRKNHLPCIVTLHGMLYPFALFSVKKNAKAILRKLVFDDALQNVDCIHATCEAEHHHYRALGFRNPVAIIPFGVAMPPGIQEIRARRKRRKRIVFLGRLHPIKNIELMLNAWAHATGMENAEFIIAGDGAQKYKQYLLAQCQKLRARNVIFTGFLADEEKLRLLADARAVVLMSKMENFGAVVPEALMVGTPALTGDRTPWATLPANHCGWHIPTTEAAFTRAFTEILSLPETQIQTMGEAGIRYFENTFFSVSAAKKMRDLYCWMLHQGEKPDFVNLN